MCFLEERKDEDCKVIVFKQFQRNIHSGIKRGTIPLLLFTFIETRNVIGV